MIEGRRRPLFLGVALSTIPGNLLVQRVGGRLMAILALLTRCFLQQGMIEVSLLHKAYHPSMVAVAGYTVLTIQLLVKGG